MPAVLVDEPLGIECSFSDGRRFSWTLKDHRCPALARDLLAGLTGLVYPHGSVDSPSTANIYRVGLLHMLGWMSERGLAGGAARLTRGRLAEYWMGADALRESTTRAMLAGVDDALGVLEPAVRELVAGRRFHPSPRRVPLQPYTETEWARLIGTCRRIITEAHARHEVARAGAARGRDPGNGGWSEENLAWLMSRDGPMSQRMFAGHVGGGVTQPRVSAACRLPEVRAALFPGIDIALAYRLLFGAYTGVVPDGVDDLGLADVDWVGDATVLLGYVKGRTAAESVTLPPKAVRLLEQWLDHSALLRRFVEPRWAGALWIRADRPDVGRPRAGRFDHATTTAWVRRNGVTADDGTPLALHLHRIRVSWHSHRDRRAWHGSARATIDPNHSPAVEGDHYLTAATPAQRQAIESIIEDAQADLVRRAVSPTVLTDEQTACLAGDYPQLVAGLELDGTVVAELAGGSRDVFVAACADQLAGLHGPKGQPCPARPWVCLLCPLAVFAPRHATNLLRLKAFFARQWRQLPQAHFMAVFGPYASRIDEVLGVLDRLDATLLSRAAGQVADRDEEIPLRPEELTR
jgi:hypothetical protein